MSIDRLFLDPDKYTLKKALSWGLFAEHLKKVKHGELSTGQKCCHIGMAVLEFFPVLSQLISLVELVTHKIFYYFNELPDDKKQPVFNDLVFADEGYKSKADELIHAINPGINNEEIQRLLNFNLPEERLWSREDLSNDSELQQIYEIMRSTWCSEDLIRNDFAYEFYMGHIRVGRPYNDILNSFISEATDIRDLIAMATIFVFHELKNGRGRDDRTYEHNTNRGCTFLAHANQEVLHTWLRKSHELLG